MPNRKVSLRRSPTSGNWVLEAPHPQLGVPQPFIIDGAFSFRTLAQAARSLGERGHLLVPNKRDGRRYLTDGRGGYLTA